MTNYFTISQAAKLLGLSKRSVRRMCITGKLPGARKDDNGNWLIPQTASAELRGIPSDKTQIDQLANISVKKRQEALEKLGHIRGFESFSGSFVRSGGNRIDAVEIYATQNKINSRTLMRWISAYRQQGIIGLVDKRGRGQFNSDTISAGAFEQFQSSWLNLRQPTVKSCWLNLKYINKTEGHNWQIPSLGSMYRLINERIPYPVQVLHREGIEAYNAKCAPYIQADPDSIEPGQVWVGDHHQFNFWIRYRNRWVRPWITAWEDMRSRTLVGWYISASPNQTTILQAMKRAVEKHGPPDSVKIDNGKDYDSEMWTGTTKARRKAIQAGYLDEQMVAGIYAMMGVGVSYSIKYHPQSKLIERLFDTIDVQFSKTFKTYCGKDSSRKPDYLPDLLKNDNAFYEAYDTESLSEMFEQYAQVYNHANHSGSGMNGKSPIEVFNSRKSQRVLAEGVTDLLLKVWSGELQVGKNGVRFRGLWYGQFNMDLAAYQAKKVRVAYDPDDVRQIDVYDARTYRLITIAEQNQLIRYGNAVSEESLRDAMRQKSQALKAAKQYKNTRLAANTDLTTLTIKAMQDNQIKDKPQENVSTIRPVITPFNNQVRQRRKQQAVKLLRKAAGAEGMSRVKLDIDFDALRSGPVNDVDLDIDFESISEKESVDLNIFTDES